LPGCDQFGSFTLLRPNRALIVLKSCSDSVKFSPSGWGAMPLTARRKAKLVTRTPHHDDSRRRRPRHPCGSVLCYPLPVVTSRGRALAAGILDQIAAPCGGRLAKLVPGKPRRPARRAVGAGSQGTAEAPIRPPASTALSDLPLPKTSEGRVVVSATAGAPGNVVRIGISTQPRSSL
jgi:hypothetical protein